MLRDLRIGDDFADAVDHGGDLFDVRLSSLDPQQVGTVLKRGAAVHDAAIVAGSGTESIEVRGKALRANQLAVAIHQHVDGFASALNTIAAQEAVLMETWQAPCPDRKNPYILTQEGHR